MSFVNSVILPGEQKTSSTGGGFLSSVVMPTDDERAKHIAQLQQEAQQAQQEAAGANSFWGTVKNTFTEIGNIGKSLVTNTVNAAKQGFNAATNTMSDVIAGGLSGQPSSIAQNFANAASVLSNVGMTLFSPITGAFQTAEQIPGLREAAKILAVPATAIDVSAKFASGKFIDSLPISEESKTILKQPIQELSSLSSQVLLGALMAKALGPLSEQAGRVKVGEKGKSFLSITPVEAKRIVVEAQSEMQQVNLRKPREMSPESLSAENAIDVSTPNKRHAAYAESQGYEPYASPDQLPVINAGRNRNAPSKIPIVEYTTEKNPSTGAYRYVPLPKEVLPPSVKGGFLERTSVPGKVVSPTSEVVTTPSPKAIAKTGEDVLKSSTEAPKESVSEPKTGSKASKVAQSVEEKALEKSFTEGFGEVAGYDPITIKDQAARASKLMETNLDDAKRMIRGEMPVEAGLKAEMLIKAMEDYAFAKGDVGLMRDIAQSPLVSETSAHAQALRILAERNPESPITLINEVKKAREKAVEKRLNGQKLDKAKSEVVKEAKEAVRSERTTRESWEDFITKLQCNY